MKFVKINTGFFKKVKFLKNVKTSTRKYLQKISQTQQKSNFIALDCLQVFQRKHFTTLFGCKSQKSLN